MPNTIHSFFQLVNEIVNIIIVQENNEIKLVNIKSYLIITAIARLAWLLYVDRRYRSLYLKCKTCFTNIIVM